MNRLRRFRLTLPDAILATVLVVVLILALGACGMPEEEGGVDLGITMSAKMVTVDGIRCIVLDGYEGDAISCEWPSP